MSLFIFPYLSALSQLVVVLVILKNRQRLDFEMKVLALYVALGLAFDIVQVGLALNKIPNLWTSHFFFPFQFALPMLVFYSWNKKSSAAKPMLISIPVLIAAWCFGSIWLRNMANTLTYVEPTSAVILVFAASYTLLGSERLEGALVFEIPAFWVSSATIIYFGGTVVLSSLSTSILKVTDPEIKRLAWSTQSVATILANLMFAGAFLCLRRKN